LVQRKSDILRIKEREKIMHYFKKLSRFWGIEQKSSKIVQTGEDIILQ
jgi:hypothetical protein